MKDKVKDLTTRLILPDLQLGKKLNSILHLASFSLHPLSFILYPLSFIPSRPTAQESLLRRPEGKPPAAQDHQADGANQYNAIPPI